MDTLAQQKVGVTNKSQTLTQLGVTINASISMLYLRPLGAVNYQFNGAAGNSSAPLADGYTGYPCTATSAALFQFFAPGETGESLDVLQVG